MNCPNCKNVLVKRKYGFFCFGCRTQRNFDLSLRDSNYNNGGAKE